MHDITDVTFTILWRDAGGDHPIAQVTHHFDPQNSGPLTMPFDADLDGMAAPAKPGNQLILRFSVAGKTPPKILYVPNADGAEANGRIPSLTLP